MNLSDLEAIGVSVRIEHRVVFSPRCSIQLLDKEMNHRELAMDGRPVRKEWKMRYSTPDGYVSQFVVRGSPKRYSHGLTVVLENDGSGIAQICDLAGATKDAPPHSVRLETGDIRVDFSADDESDASEVSLIARSRGDIVGRFWLHDSVSGSLVVDGLTSIDVRVAAAVCLDLQTYFASAADTDNFVGEIMSYFR